MHYSWYWFGEGHIVYTTEESTGKARRWIQSCDNTIWRRSETFIRHMPEPTPLDLCWNSSTKWRMTCGRQRSGGTRACSSFCAEVYKIAPFPWNPLLQWTISTDCSWYVTHYLTCSQDTLFMASCYPLQAEILFIHTKFWSEITLNFSCIRFSASYLRPSIKKLNYHIT